jgi:hypothetical protein
VQEENHRLKRVTDYPWHEYYGGECQGVYFIRLQRDGWQMKHTSSDTQGGEITLFEKRINNHWLLRKHAHATIHHPVERGVYYDTHELYNSRTEEVLTKENWEWAEIDGGRLVWAADGCLHAGHVNANGLHGEKQLCDFEPMPFEKLVAPY